MTLDRSPLSRRAARLASGGLVLLATASVFAGHASAVVKPAPAPRVMSASIEESGTAVPVGGNIGLTAVIRLPRAASYLQARVQIKQNAGHVVFQRTKTLSNAAAATYRFAFSRPLEGLGLEPGVYPVSLQVHAVVGGSTVTTEVAADLRVFDPVRPRVPVALIARVDTRPMADPSGRFVVDPATATKARDDVDRITTIVLADQAAHVTMALSPLALEEWRGVSRGYTLASGAKVPATSPVSLAYATTLQRLKDAMQTGRFELTALGYSDPSLADLAANKLADDVGVQYETGLSACFASLESTPSTGTVPAGTTVPTAVIRPLAAQGIRYVVVDSASARLAKKAAPSGCYPIGGVKVNALVPDGAGSKALAAGETSVAVAASFQRAESNNPRQSYAVRVELGDGGPSATSTVLPALQAFESAPWVRLQLGRECSPPKGTKSVNLPGTPAASTHKAFWAAVRAGRTNAEALLAALGAGSQSASDAQSQSLVSESHAWSEPAGTYALAAQGTDFAQAAYHAGRAIFDKIHMSAQPVTLAGATGQVPVNIQNSTQQTLTVYIVARADSGIEVVGNGRVATKLPPRETFVQVPVDMHSALNGHLTVEVMSGPLVISRQTVAIRRSYLDRLALIVGIVVVLGGLLAFIVRRVATSPEIGDENDEARASDSPEGYTESGPPEDVEELQR
jgi:hypothetical protein